MKTHEVRPSGTGRVEILLPQGDPAAVEQAKKLAGCRGLLELRICADPADTPNYDKIGSDHQKGTAPPSEYEWLPLRWDCGTQWMEIVRFLWFRTDLPTSEQALTRYDGNLAVFSMVRSAAVPHPGHVDILVLRYTSRVEGIDFSEVRKTASVEDGAPIITFKMKANAQGRLGELAGAHIGKRLACVLDGKVWWAPPIRTTVKTAAMLSGFESKEDRDAVYAVLQSGALPTDLRLIGEGPLP
jgi:hypothetical protein